jgi:hypothetical protein
MVSVAVAFSITVVGGFLFAALSFLFAALSFLFAALSFLFAEVSILDCLLLGRGRLPEAATEDVMWTCVQEHLVGVNF